MTHYSSSIISALLDNIQQHAVELHKQPMRTVLGVQLILVVLFKVGVEWVHICGISDTCALAECNGLAWRCRVVMHRQRIHQTWLTWLRRR